MAPGVPPGAVYPHRHHHPHSLSPHPTDTGCGHTDPGCPQGPPNTPGESMDHRGAPETPPPSPRRSDALCNEAKSPQREPAVPSPRAGDRRGSGTLPRQMGQQERGDRGPQQCLGDRGGTGQQGSQEPKHSPMEGAGAMGHSPEEGSAPWKSRCTKRHPSWPLLPHWPQASGRAPEPRIPSQPTLCGEPRCRLSVGALRTRGSRGFLGLPGPTCTHQAAPADAEVRGAGAAAGAVQCPAEGVVEVVPHGQAVEVADVGGCRNPGGWEGGDAGDSRGPRPAR